MERFGEKFSHTFRKSPALLTIVYAIADAKCSCLVLPFCEQFANNRYRKFTIIFEKNLHRTASLPKTQDT